MEQNTTGKDFKYYVATTHTDVSLKIVCYFKNGT